ncbi:RsmE family RNA methyltransferase [Bacteroidota bacterium]
MHTFYIPEDILNLASLSEDESKHAVRVLRLKAGDRFQIVNGSGDIMRCSIMDANPKKCSFRVESKKHIDRKSYYIHLAIAPTKNLDRMEWMVEKCTEIGIDEISFFYSNNSERKILKLDRLVKKSIGALKQSRNYYLPKLNNIESFKTLVDNVPDDYEKYIGIIFENEQSNLIHKAEPGHKYYILVGPEGDFLKEEVDHAKKRSFIPVSLGNTTLRTETAGIYACTTLNILNQ